MGTTTTKSNMDKYIITVRTISHEDGLEDSDETFSNLCDGVDALQKALPYTIPVHQVYYRDSDGKKMNGKITKKVIRNEAGDIIGYDIDRDIHCCGQEKICGNEHSEIRVSKMVDTYDIGNIIKANYRNPYEY